MPKGGADGGVKCAKTKKVRKSREKCQTFPKQLSQLIVNQDVWNFTIRFLRFQACFLLYWKVPNFAICSVVCLLSTKYKKKLKLRSFRFLSMENRYFLSLKKFLLSLSDLHKVNRENHVSFFSFTGLIQLADTFVLVVLILLPWQFRL